VVKVAAILVLVLIGSALAVVLAPNGPFRSYSHRYRLTVSVAIDGETRSGSSVIEVVWRKSPPLSSVPWESKIVGQAALVDLGRHGILAAVLGGMHGVPADFLALHAFGVFGTQPRTFAPDDEGLRALSRVRGHVGLTPARLPDFIWFSDPTDPGTAVPVRAEDFGLVISPEVRLVGAYLEITTDPITAGVGQRLPWLRALYDDQRKNGITGYPGAFVLSVFAFIQGGAP
jgi:hypothetical protein